MGLLSEIFSLPFKIAGAITGSILGIASAIVAEVLGITIAMVEEAKKAGCKTYEEVRNFHNL